MDNSDRVECSQDQIVSFVKAKENVSMPVGFDIVDIPLSLEALYLIEDSFICLSVCDVGRATFAYNWTLKEVESQPRDNQRVKKSHWKTRSREIRIYRATGAGKSSGPVSISDSVLGPIG
ncbi:hypothetical protein WN51_04835 [Melipona quadrifasciata]|uniref:Uncharacterized protein n=1 Tax=Melipona quadrifasciata TaxID=166423 RepID=A0A0N0U3X0_9HYME|nr:hypothetical protein WN51_04835 [Melipona quadrifasciata]